MAAPLPIIAGVAQFNPRAQGMENSPEPLELTALVARAAAEDCGQPAILHSLDAVAVVNIISWRYPNAPGALAERLGIKPRALYCSSVGGNTPQYLVNHFAGKISSGRMRAVLIAGAEALHTIRRLMKHGGAKWGALGRGGTPTRLGDDRAGTNALEERYGARLPVQIYPLFENARRADNRWSIGEHREYMGRLFASMSKVAAQNPHAWFREERSAEQLMAVTLDNRMICFPYPKLMNAIIDVDLAAALVLTSDQEARRLGIASERFVYLHAGADATDRWFIGERESFRRSAAMKAALTSALEGAGSDVGQIDFFDVYSCFPAAVGFALDALGLSADDPRGVTVTGGLPYAGGPGNNYSTHAIAAMVERLRAHPEKRGMVTALGWYMTKHAAAVYSSAPPSRGFIRADSTMLSNQAAASGAQVRVAESAAGDATIETYTVIHDRAGEPSDAVIVGRLDDGSRFFAKTLREVLPSMEREEFVGIRGHVRPIDGINTFEPA